jgi:hypothetical protein
MNIAQDLLVPHWRGNGRALGMCVALDLLPSGKFPHWRGNGRAFGMNVALDLVPFPISKATAELLGCPLVRQWPSLWDKSRLGSPVFKSLRDLVLVLVSFPVGEAMAEPLG